MYKKKLKSVIVLMNYAWNGNIAVNEELLTGARFITEQSELIAYYQCEN